MEKYKSMLAKLIPHVNKRHSRREVLLPIQKENQKLNRKENFIDWIFSVFLIKNNNYIIKFTVFN